MVFQRLLWPLPISKETAPHTCVLTCRFELWNLKALNSKESLEPLTLILSHFYRYFTAIKFLLIPTSNGCLCLTASTPTPSV